MLVVAVYVIRDQRGGSESRPVAPAKCELSESQCADQRLIRELWDKIDATGLDGVSIVSRLWPFRRYMTFVGWPILSRSSAYV